MFNDVSVARFAYLLHFIHGKGMGMATDPVLTRSRLKRGESGAADFTLDSLHRAFLNIADSVRCRCLFTSSDSDRGCMI